MEDVEVCLVMCPVLNIESILVDIQAVAVLHREFAHPDQPGPWPRIIAPFGLNVVDQHR